MSWQDIMRERIPRLTTAAFQWIPGNIIIVDIENEDEAYSLLSGIAYQVPVIYVFASYLTQTLQSIVPWDSYDQLIWPGNGAKIVQRKLQLCNKGINVNAKRIGYRNPLVEVDSFKSAGRRSLIIDDVVCTGMTALETARRGVLVNPSLAAWIIQYPRQLLNGFSEVWCALAVRGPDGRVPVNSLSTLITHDNIANDYAIRFCANPDELLTACELLE